MTAGKRTYFARRRPMIATNAIYDNYQALENAVHLLIQKHDLKLARRVYVPLQDLHQEWFCYAGAAVHTSPCASDCPYKISAIALSNGKWLVARFNRHHSWELQQLLEDDKSTEANQIPTSISAEATASVSPANSSASIPEAPSITSSLEPPGEATYDSGADTTQLETGTSDIDADQVPKASPVSLNEDLSSSEAEKQSTAATTAVEEAEDCLLNHGGSSTTPEPQSSVDELVALATLYSRSTISLCNAPDSFPLFDLEQDDPLHILSKSAMPPDSKVTLDAKCPPHIDTRGAAINGISTFQADANYTAFQQNLIALPLHLTLSADLSSADLQPDKQMELDGCSTSSNSPAQKEVMTLSAISAMPSPPPTPASFVDIDMDAEGDTSDYWKYVNLSPEPKPSPLQTFPIFDAGECSDTPLELNVMEETGKLVHRHPSSKQASPDADALTFDHVCKADHVSNASSELTSLASLGGSSLASGTASTDIRVPVFDEDGKSAKQADRSLAQICNQCKTKKRPADMVQCSGKHDKPRWTHLGCMSAAERSVLMFKTEKKWLCRKCDSYAETDAEEPQVRARAGDLDSASMGSTQLQAEHIENQLPEVAIVMPDLGYHAQAAASTSRLTPDLSQPAEESATKISSGIIFEGFYIPPEEPVRRVSRRLSKRPRPSKAGEVVEPPKKKVAFTSTSEAVKPKAKSQPRPTAFKSGARSKQKQKVVEEEDDEAEPIMVAMSVDLFSKKRSRKAGEAFEGEKPIRELSPELMVETSPYIEQSANDQIGPLLGDLPPTPSTSGARSLSPLPCTPSLGQMRSAFQGYPDTIQEALKRVGVVNDAALQALQLEGKDLTAFIDYLESVNEDQGEEPDDDGSDMDEDDKEGVKADEGDEASEEEDEAIDDTYEHEDEKKEEDRELSDAIEVWRLKNLLTEAIAEGNGRQRGDSREELYSWLPRASLQALKQMGIDNSQDLLARFSRQTAEAFFTDTSRFVNEGPFGSLNGAERWLTLRRICQMYDWEYMEATDNTTPLRDIWAFKINLADLGEASQLGMVNSGHRMQDY